jgi:Fe-S cluster biosynthesis and repair protein YggX
MVQCAKLGRELPGLESPPFPGEIGEKIYNNISQEAWTMWKDHQVLLINHNGLMMADPRARKFLREEMMAFLFEDTIELPEGWSPEAARPQAKGGGGRSK